MIEEPKMFKTMLMGNILCHPTGGVKETILSGLVKCRAFEIGPVIEEASINDTPIPKEGLFPPFDYGWFEWCQEGPEVGGLARLGLLVESTRTEKGWMVECASFSQAPLSDAPVGPILTCKLEVDSGGRFVPETADITWFYQTDQVCPEVIGETSYGLMSMIRLAFSRLNSRHTITEEHQWEPHVLKRIQRTCRQPSKGFVYHVIKVACIVKGEKTGTVRQYRSMHQMLHSVRGHGKTYVTKGLFGRHLGTFYWPYHYRGDPGLGVVGKHYLVGVR